MKTLFLWMAGGISLVTGIFFVPEQSGSLWPSVILSSFAAFLYILAFSLVWIKKIQSEQKRKLIGWTLAILVVFSIASASLSYIGSEYQARNLSAIRSTIETNLARIHVREPLTKTLTEYYSEKNKNGDITIGQLFREKYHSLTTTDRIFRQGEMLTVYLAKASSDSVVLVAESAYKDGKESTFKNFSGAEGRYETRGILTAEGVRYERTN